MIHITQPYGNEYQSEMKPIEHEVKYVQRPAPNRQERENAMQMRRVYRVESQVLGKQ